MIPAINVKTYALKINPKILNITLRIGTKTAIIKQAMIKAIIVNMLSSYER